MSRPARRISRPFIVVLILMLLIGAISILQKGNHAPANAIGNAMPQPFAQQPATQPALVNNVDLPATRPGALPSPQASATGKKSPAISDSSEAPVIPTGEVAPASPQQDAVLVSQKLVPATMPSSMLITQAKTKIDGGKLLEARSQLNQALQSGQLEEAQATSIKEMISQINQTVVFGKQKFADDPYGGTYVVQSGENLAKIAGAHDCTWEFLSRINGIEPKALRAGATIKLVEGPFFGVVDKKKFAMDIYLGGLPGEASSMYIATYPVGLGEDDSTPTGTWMIEIHKKLKKPTYYSPRGGGIIAADDPKNPLGGFWIGLTGTDGQAVGKLSYGIHGTIDPTSIGKQSSMGCIRLKADDIAMVYDMMVEGKSLVVVR